MHADRSTIYLSVMHGQQTGKPENTFAYFLDENARNLYHRES